MTAAQSREESWRLFIAIELPLDLRRQITAHINNLRRSFPVAHCSWNREDNLHLTLKFLGDVPLEKIESISRLTDSTAHSFEQFRIVVGGCGVFPARGQPSVLWIGIEDPDSHLALLHQKLEAACAKVGIAAEARPFRPHLTIARVRKPKGSRQLGRQPQEIGFPNQTVNVSEIVLFRSELLSEGVRHTAISRHRLS